MYFLPLDWHDFPFVSFFWYWSSPPRIGLRIRELKCRKGFSTFPSLASTEVWKWVSTGNSNWGFNISGRTFWRLTISSSNYLRALTDFTNLAYFYSLLFYCCFVIPSPKPPSQNSKKSATIKQLPRDFSFKGERWSTVFVEHMGK